MGAALSKTWNATERRHRLLGQAISNSTYIDPRHLEHFAYPLWTTEAAHIIALSAIDDFMVAPQFPMWVSETEEPAIGSDPDVSGMTTADPTARGVFVDMAIIQPIVMPRSLGLFKKHKDILKRLSLQAFIQNFLNPRHAVAKLPPRALWTDELWAPVLIEIKTDAMRHPVTLTEYVTAIRRRLLDGRQQAEEQGTCLFCSWRFASQEIVFIIAVTGEFWVVRQFLRSEAAEEFKDNRRFDVTVLQELKARRDEAAEADTWNTAVHEKMFSSPQTAKQKRLELLEDYNRKRDERAANRASRREHLPADGVDARTPPNYDDRGLPLFSDEDLEACYMQLFSAPLFEHRSPEDFFAEKQDAKWSQWTGALRLGSKLSDEYKEFISSYLAQAHVTEVKRRQAEKFA